MFATLQRTRMLFEPKSGSQINQNLVRKSCCGFDSLPLALPSGFDKRLVEMQNG
jgi:hypothetical protein